MEVALLGFPTGRTQEGAKQQVPPPGWVLSEPVPGPFCRPPPCHPESVTAGESLRLQGSHHVSCGKGVRRPRPS